MKKDLVEGVFAVVWAGLAGYLIYNVWKGGSFLPLVFVLPVLARYVIRRFRRKPVQPPPELVQAPLRHRH